MNSPKQQEIIDLLQTRVSMTAAEIAFSVGSEVKATSKHLRLLEDMGKIYVCEWRKGKHGVPTKAYTLGEGESVVLVRKKKKSTQDETRKSFNRRNLYDPASPVVANTGWVSTIHSKDYTMQHGEHIKYMERFQPHPDHASEWLFNEPKVELLGARYDLVQA
jgi:DNA-binding transcriptional ArsR family regulator